MLQKWNIKPLANIKAKQTLENRNNFIDPARLIMVSLTIMFVDMAKRIEIAATEVSISPEFTNSETENVTTLRLAKPPRAEVA